MYRPCSLLKHNNRGIEMSYKSSYYLTICWLKHNNKCFEIGETLGTSQNHGEV